MMKTKTFEITFLFLENPEKNRGCQLQIASKIFKIYKSPYNPKQTMSSLTMSTPAPKAVTKASANSLTPSQDAPGT